MLSPTDLDALLVSSLYGDLSSGERSQLDAHLRANPQDRQVLDGLTQVRSWLASSGLLAHIEPPPAISAKLLQTAAKLAPTEGGFGGIWARFVSMFAAMGRHPAMAGAAMLFVVVGVAGVISLRGGSRAQMAEATSAGPAEATVALESKMSEPAAVARGEATSGQDYDSAQPVTTAATTASESDVAADPPTGGKANRLGTLAGTRDQARDGYVAGLAPDDLGKLKGSPKDAKQDKSGGEAKAITRAIPLPSTESIAILDEEQGNYASKINEPTRDDAAPVKPSVVAKAPTSATGGGVTGGVVADSVAANEKPSDDASTETAAQLHAKAVSQVGQGKCAEAAAAARSIAARFPSYYAAEVSADRRLKSCKPYIDKAVAADKSSR